MPDYKETTVAGSSFSRCRLVEIRNPYQQNASVTFTEERITNLEGRVLRDQPDAPITAEYRPDTVMQMYDPATLEPLGSTITMSDVYAILFSAYLHYAKRRDATELSRSPSAAKAEASALGDTTVAQTSAP